MTTANRDKDVAVLTLQFIEEVTSKCKEQQREVLARILSQNADTEYLKRHGLKGCVDLETFKNKVPVVTYEDIQPDIQRIANGDSSPILCAQPITEFFISSGTSAGKAKLIPTTAEDKDSRTLLHSQYMSFMNECIPELGKGKRLYFLFTKTEKKTLGGLVVSPFTTSFFKSSHFRNRPNNYTSPNEAILCPDSFQSMYTQMLCGFYERNEVLCIGAIFASGLLRAIRFLQVHFFNLCHDITTGTLSSTITHSGLRACMDKIMRPDPELGRFINYVCEGENWEGIIKRIWPNTKYLDVIVTGAMAQYIPMLDYYSGGLHKISNKYVSSECLFGPNLNPMCVPSEVSYTILPNTTYFEFIPLDDSSTHPIVELANVEVGKEYEIVVTTQSGLYRYKVGDVLYVTGFHNSTPQVKFVRRKNILLSIDIDNTDESELQNAIESASTLLKTFDARVVEYTSYANVKSLPGHYVIYLELLTNDTATELDHEELGQCSLAIEEALNSVYRRSRAVHKSVGPLEIRVVKNGTFEELMDYAISRGASVNQYKVPRCVNDMSIVELLDSKVVLAQESLTMPHWSP